MDIQLMFLQIRWHMQMIEHNHFIYHFCCNFSLFSHILLFAKTWHSSGRSLITSSGFVCKIMSCRFLRSVPDLVYHHYSICRMYSEENS